MTANLINKPYNQNGLYNPNYLNKRQITNCLLEVPQRINLQLNNGTLTLKAGSVVIFPYGTADKTAEYPVGSTFLKDNYKVYDTQYANGQFFVWVEIQSDMTYTLNYSTTGKIVVMLTVTGIMDSERFSIISSGTTFGHHDQYGTWYDTVNNFIKRTTNTGSTWEPYFSFPLALISGDGASPISTITTIAQVFNGFGYIGSTVWVDKGVKGLIPNGRNDDETLKNIEYTTSKLAITTNTVSNTGVNNLRLSADGTVNRVTYLGEFENAPAASGYWGLYYNSTENRMYYNSQNSWIPVHSLVCTQRFSNETTGVVNSAQFKQTFRAADVSLVEMLIKSFNTSLKAANGYVKLGDGVIIQWGRLTSQNSQNYSVTLPTPFSSNNSYVPLIIDSTTSNGQSHCSVTTATTTTFSGKHSSDGANMFWIAIGY